MSVSTASGSTAPRCPADTDPGRCTFPAASVITAGRIFRKDTGLDLPEKVDFEDRTFRIWVNWRYDVLMDVYKRICDAVAEVRPYHRCHRLQQLSHANIGKFIWNTAIPLRTININGFMSTEADCFANQVDFQMKINRAFGAKLGVESWMELCDYWTMWVSGRRASFSGSGCAGMYLCGWWDIFRHRSRPSIIPNILKPMQEAAAPLMPYIGGETVEYAAILCCQQTQDFCGKDDGAAFFDEWHGATKFAGHSHVQSSVVFDDHVERGELDKYPIIILGNARVIE